VLKHFNIHEQNVSRFDDKWLCPCAIKIDQVLLLATGLHQAKVDMFCKLLAFFRHGFSTRSEV